MDQEIKVGVYCLRDIERRCDNLMKSINNMGYHIDSDIIYEEAPDSDGERFEYFGGIGSTAKMVSSDDPEGKPMGIPTMDMNATVAYGWLYMLIGYSQCLWEMGMRLTFGKDKGHKIYAVESKEVDMR